jgi:predicted DNA-binding transcriptional regulator AlpA
MTSEPLLTTADLAHRWQTTEQAVYAARHRGDCPRAIRQGKRLLWRIKDIEEWEDARAEQDAGRSSNVARLPSMQLVASSHRPT